MTRTIERLARARAHRARAMAHDPPSPPPHTRVINPRASRHRLRRARTSDVTAGGTGFPSSVAFPLVSPAFTARATTETEDALDVGRLLAPACLPARVA